MRTLKQIIDTGAEHIRAGKIDTVEAMAFMAYQAGISRGDLLLRGKVQDDLAKAQTSAAAERFCHVAAKHLPASPPNVVNPECDELLSHAYPL